MNKSDYDKYYKKGGTYVIPVEVFNELYDEIERISSSYEQALEEVERLNNILNELEKFICDLEIECNIDSSMWGVAAIIHNKLKELQAINKQVEEMG